MRTLAIILALALAGCQNMTPEQQAETQLRWSRVATAALEAGFKVDAKPPSETAD